MTFVERISRPVAAFWRKAYEDNLTGLASMVAYSLLLSIFPLALIALFVAGRIVSSPELAASVIEDARHIFPTAAESTLVEGVRRLQSASTTVGIVALVSALWVGASFWGALDTAFCRIYRLPCRSWVRQKLFGFGMLAVVLLFIAASVAVPTFQSLLVSSARDLPFGLSHVRGLVYWLSILAGLTILFLALCVTYFAVPKGPIPWSCVWPGALGATAAMGVVDVGFPLYLSNISTLRIGTSAVFVLIALVWFYVLALVLLAGAVVNELRLEARGTRAWGSLDRMPDPETDSLRVEQVRREIAERKRAEEAGEPAETRAHQRRAERAAYLREKLRERARSEDEAAEDREG
jgi:YihY family inner membrane protein